MIYIVDEDVRKNAALVAELRLRGFDVTTIRDADDGYRILEKVALATIELVIIDVMLSTAYDPTISRYSVKDSDWCHKTGLLLLEDLVISNPEVFPKRAVFFTHATSELLVASIGVVARKYGVKVLKKREFKTAFQFGEEIDAIIKSMNISG